MTSAPAQTARGFWNEIANKWGVVSESQRGCLGKESGRWHPSRPIISCTHTRLCSGRYILNGGARIPSPEPPCPPGIQSTVGRCRRQVVVRVCSQMTQRVPRHTQSFESITTDTRAIKSTSCVEEFETRIFSDGILIRYNGRKHTTSMIRMTRHQTWKGTGHPLGATKMTVGVHASHVWDMSEGLAGSDHGSGIVACNFRSNL